MTPSLSRRRLLSGLGAVGIGGLVAADAMATSVSAANATQVVPFNAEHQAGITTPQQDRLTFAAFDVITKDRDELVRVLKTWTAAAEAMTKGHLVPGGAADLQAPPADTGEADGLKPGNLTVTIGFGTSLFDDRFGLAAKRPKALTPLPKLVPEDLDPAYTNGDLCIQACADDPQVTFHAVRNLARLGAGTVVLRWMQLGFGRTASTSSAQATPRNLMGFKDGTRNLRSEQTDLIDQNVWVGQETDQEWLRGGSYLVARRIRMYIETWDRDYLGDQQKVFGRYKTSGAPLGGAEEFDTPNLGSTDIPDDAHIRLASPEHNGGIHLLRRGYSFTDGTDSTGNLLGGLFFIAFMKDPKQFVTVQKALAADALNEYIQHIGSGLFACPPGVTPGQFWGQGLFT
ncbi:iron uptake transporter deferrochelatase/peroxidase subunit [Kutzneria sp. 744]|uniref:iron uptake transporter deferrochelatase/peroxidase subunit n=1 Tax=Kutzneria sp. (strain 744) TaxID=345341 RepID=UPI0003EEA594|nr:iron uptake transporter deferrochelatase/peroxidase subunit [Kutzneria sp. 744]EWM15757.1 iron-dependent peroxidase [Kutzneria sp. 744]